MDLELLQGDCMELLATLPAHSVDLCLTDPPFGTTSGNAWDKALDLPALWAQLRRVMRPHGAIVLFGVQPFTSDLVASHRKGYKHRWIWQKNIAGNFVVAAHMPLSVDEDILIFTANGERADYYPIMRPGVMMHHKQGKSEKTGRGFGAIQPRAHSSSERHPTNILSFAVVDRRQSLHESQKPLPLLEYLIRTYSQPGELVLDFAMGSGSTGHAAVRTQRAFVGVELTEKYYRIAKERIERASYQWPLFEEQGGGAWMPYEAPAQ